MTDAPATPAASVTNAPLVLRETSDAIAILTLNRPEARNSLSAAMIVALGEAFDAIARDRSIRAVVLAANGPAFSAGHDLKELAVRRADPDLGRGRAADRARQPRRRTWHRAGRGARARTQDRREVDPCGEDRQGSLLPSGGNGPCCRLRLCLQRDGREHAGAGRRGGDCGV